MRGEFTGVVTGEWRTTGSGLPLGPVLVLLALAGASAWLATIMLMLAVILGAGLVLAVAGLAVAWRVSRPNPRDQELLAERWQAMHAETARQVTPQQVTHIHGGIHYHLGGGLSGTVPQVIRVSPERNAIAAEAEN